MAQTTNALSMKDCTIWFSTSGSTWVDASGDANTVTISGGARNIGSAMTADGDTPIIKAGKRNELTVAVNALYTDNATGVIERAVTAYEGASAFYVRWAPKSTSSGSERFTTAAGIVQNPLYPGGDVGPGDPIALSVDVVVPSITQATITSAG